MITKTYNREEFAEEFAKRTIDNYNSYTGTYEITQLINSLLGMLVIPKETFARKVNNRIIDSIVLNQLQSMVEEYCVNGIDKIPSLDSILVSIRNALCHGQVNFVCEKLPKINKPEKITAIEFINDYSNGDYDIYFKAVIDIKTLELLVIEYIKTIQNNRT